MTSDSEPIREDNQTPDAKGKANIETGHADPNISPIKTSTMITSSVSLFRERGAQSNSR